MAPDSMPTKDAEQAAIDAATEKAEKQIQAILLGLEQDANRRVDQVNVDVRNFANRRTEIFLR